MVWQSLLRFFLLLHFVMASQLQLECPVRADDPQQNKLDTAPLANLKPLTIVDLDGGSHELSAADAEQRYSVVLFTNTDCPIANAYHPELSRLHEKFSDHGFDMLMVYADTKLTKEAAKEHQQEYSIKWSIALDPQQKVARYLSATTTPEVVVVDAKGKIRYRGRIDDRFAAYGKKRAEPTRRDLEIALQSLLMDQPIEVASTKPVGCRISYNQ